MAEHRLDIVPDAKHGALMRKLGITDTRLLHDPRRTGRAKPRAPAHAAFTRATPPELILCVHCLKPIHVWWRGQAWVHKHGSELCEDAAIDERVFA